MVLVVWECILSKLIFSNLMLKKLALIFIIAFILNFIWENLHVFLYEDYMGGKITEFILFRATLADALIITIISLPFFLPRFEKYNVVIIFIGLVIAIFNEIYALSTDRWSYNALMPIVPFLNVGITPTVQLGLLGYVSYKFSGVFKKLNITF